jgi:hypothetical protein
VHVNFYVHVTAHGNGRWTATATAPHDTIRFDLETSGAPTFGGRVQVTGTIAGSVRDREVDPFHRVNDVRFETANESGATRMQGHTSGGSTPMVIGELVGRFSFTDSAGVGASCGYGGWTLSPHVPQNTPLGR